MTRDITLADLDAVQKKLDAARQKEMRYVAQMEQIAETVKQLHAELRKLGVSSIEEAREQVTKLEARRAEILAQLEKEL